MKKILTLLLAISFAMGTMSIAFADDDDYEHYHHRYHHQIHHDYDDDDYDDDDYDYDDDEDYKYWREHGNYDRWRARRYKNWYRRCSAYGGLECSYSRWGKNENWDYDDWDNYWNTHRRQNYEKIRKIHHKAGALHNVIRATRDLFYW